ncbi:MAG: hypothetical protein R2701_03635 [Acidimicrobiales bacterium]
MSSTIATIPVRLGFTPASAAIDDPDHPGLRRAGPRTTGPYGTKDVELHTCAATDLAQDPAVAPDLFELGFDTVDLTPLDDLQQTLRRVAAAGRIADDDAALVRAALDGAALRCSSGATATVLHIADEGFIMRSSGPNRRSVTRPESTDMNDHGAATSVHADQDVYGTPLRQVMDGRAPSLLRHDSPDGHNHDASLMLANLWIPLQQIVQPLVLADPRTVDRRRHQRRYGLPTGTFLERDDDMAINDIWTFLHDPDQRWFLRSEMDHTSAYLFNTLSAPHGACTLPGEDVAERCFLALADAEAAVADGDAAALVEALAPVAAVSVPDETTPALRAAIEAMAAVAVTARRDPTTTCGEGAEAWTAASRAARERVIRRSLELRLVVSVAA